MGSLKLLTLNMNTGHGPRGDFRRPMRRKKLLRNLQRIEDVIRKADPDVVFLQEVDIRWAGTWDINQAEYLRSKCGYGHCFYHAHHRSPIPSILRSISRPPGGVILNRDVGTAILSRQPLISKRAYDFGQSYSSFSSVNYAARLLNESKGYTYARMMGPSGPVGLMNVHLLNDVLYQMFHALGRRIRGETFARVFQMQKLLEHVREHLESTGIPLIVAGDLNTVPTESQLDFAYSRAGDPDTYERDISLVLLRESRLLRTIPILQGEGDHESIRPFWTYPSDPDRTIDYIFISEGLEFDGYEVLPDPVSDHLAVLATIKGGGVRWPGIICPHQG